MLLKSKSKSKSSSLAFLTEPRLLGASFLCDLSAFLQEEVLCLGALPASSGFSLGQGRSHLLRQAGSEAHCPEYPCPLLVLVSVTACIIIRNN